MDQLSAYGARDAVASMSGEVLHHAKRAALDWFSALLAGVSMPPAKQLLEAHRSELGVGQSSIPGHGTTAFSAAAAWINGTTSHTAEFDDIFRDAAYHPGCVVIPAALAVAEEHSRTGLDLLRAIVVGYEISTRIGVAVQPHHYRYFHPTGTIGCFGAAAAASALIAPGDARVMAHSLATAATFAAGLQQAFRSDSMTKPLHAGHAACMGVRAAQVASNGITGALDILEGPAGIGAALCGAADWSLATDQLGERYNITRITQKAYACCGHTFAALDAVLALSKRFEIQPDQIADVRVRTYQVAIDVTGNQNPVSAAEARFSLPYVLAYALIVGAPRLEAFSQSSLNNPMIRALMARIHSSASPEFTAGFPRQRAAWVEITLESGKTCSLLAPHRQGDPEAPLADVELNAKFKELVVPVLGLEASETLQEHIWRMDRVIDLRSLTTIANENPDVEWRK